MSTDNDEKKRSYDLTEKVKKANREKYEGDEEEVAELKGRVTSKAEKIYDECFWEVFEGEYLKENIEKKELVRRAAPLFDKDKGGTVSNVAYREAESRIAATYLCADEEKQERAFDNIRLLTKLNLINIAVTNAHEHNNIEEYREKLNSYGVNGMSFFEALGYAKSEYVKVFANNVQVVANNLTEK